MKDFIKSRWRLLLVVTSFAAVAIVFFNILWGDPNLANAIVAFGTLTLALVTALHIMNSNEQEMRRRKEGLLTEIIEWGINFTKRPSEKVFRDMASATGTEKVRLYVHAHIVEVKESFVGMSGRNLYISNLALKFEQGLQKAVEELIKDLNAYIEFLDEWQHTMAEAITKKMADKEEYFKKADEYALQLDKSANKVIKEATKIKTKDIS